MAIVRRGTDRMWTDGTSDAYVYTGARGEEILFGDKDSEDSTEMVALSPEDTTEVVCRLLERADYDDVAAVRDALIKWQAELD